MNNHVHLIATPSPRDESRNWFSGLRSCVALFNGRHGRTGTISEGRYKAFLVDSANYVFFCCRYLELNPVRVRLATTPSVR
ncbi:hypothetical protein [Xanthomonas arboricola]|uniref:hypothetical protein n=1 Tax=Xanthomonas arboricola TaxID=56448 RepID=UPI000AB1665E|nr:hypothetical protein [Xanthomonas arboricola]